MITKKKLWKFKLANTARINISKYIGPIDDYVFVDYVNGQIEIVGFIVDGWLTILAGYEWDGCTPKFSIFGKIVGVPDFKRNYEGSLVHDFLIEYCIQHKITRKQIDKIFQGILWDKKFILGPVYAGAVHLFRPIALASGPCKK